MSLKSKRFYKRVDTSPCLAKGTRIALFTVLDKGKQCYSCALGEAWRSINSFIKSL